MISIRLSFRMNSILSNEIPFLNFTNSSCGMNRSEWDFEGRSIVDVGVAVWLLAPQDVGDHSTHAHSMIGANRIAWSGKGSQDLNMFLSEPGSISLRIVDKAQFMLSQAALLTVTLSSRRNAPLSDAPIWREWRRSRGRPDRSQARNGPRQVVIPRGKSHRN